jgi:hypothetical protein
MTENFKTIPLTQGKVAIVDIDDFEVLNRYVWRASHENNTWYAIRYENINGKQKSIRMHKQVTGFKYKMVDHINQDGLDNRKNNLRNCNHSQNRMNSRLDMDNRSGLRGVCWIKNKNCWRASIKKGAEFIHIGYFDDKKVAGLAYDRKAKELFGEFAVLNFPEWENDYYKKSEIDTRIKFYDDINKTRADDVPKWLFKALPDRHRDFLSALFTFCFKDMNEDFREKIKKLGGTL